MRTWIAICIGAATVWSYLKQIGRKGSKLCQKRFMQICLILSPNYLFNMPTPSHGGRERPTGRGNLLMNRASEGGGEVSWSLPGPEIWQLWEILQFSDKKGTRRCDWRRRTHLAISRKSTDLRFLQICSPFQVIECEQVVRWKLENHSTQKHKIMTLDLQKNFFL